MKIVRLGIGRLRDKLRASQQTWMDSMNSVEINCGDYKCY